LERLEVCFQCFLIGLDYRLVIQLFPFILGLGEFKYLDCVTLYPTTEEEEGSNC
jgi:hypothetical protein